MDCLIRWIELHPGLASWTQALGAILALLIAIYVPWDQHRKETLARKLESIQQQKSMRQKLTAGLSAEVKAIDEVLESRYETAKQVLDKLAVAEMAGRPIDTGDLPADAIHVTDAAIYRAVTQDLGVLPTELIGSIVSFYTLISQVEHTASLSTSFEGVLDVQVSMIPRLRMSGGFLRIALERYVRSDFQDEIDVQPSNEEARAEAARVSYPLHEIAAQFGKVLRA